MKKEAALRYVGFNVNDDREKDDFYPTPIEATQALLDREKFTGNVLEPACGDGAMSKVLINNGYQVISSDYLIEVMERQVLIFYTQHKCMTTLSLTHLLN